MVRVRTTSFNPEAFLTKVGKGRTSLTVSRKHSIFSQGEVADAIFYIQTGKIKLTVVSQQGKEAVVAILEPGAFFGESCLAGQAVRTATTTALEDCSIVRIDKDAMIRVLHEEPTFAELFMPYLLRHTIRIEEDYGVNLGLGRMRVIGMEAMWRYGSLVHPSLSTLNQPSGNAWASARQRCTASVR